jgi:hypothetical protein
MDTFLNYLKIVGLSILAISYFGLLGWLFMKLFKTIYSLFKTANKTTSKQQQNDNQNSYTNKNG